VTARLAGAGSPALVANRAQNHRRGGALGVQQSAGALARVVGPAVGGALFHHVGIAAPYLIGAVLVALVAVMLALDREPQPAPSGVPS
jgi:MFS family permease